MPSIRHAAFCFALLVAALAVPREAHALKKIYLTDTGTSVIGQLWGGTWMCTQTSVSTIYKYLGPSPLDDNLEIHATGGGDRMVILTGPLTTCGNNFSAPSLAGHYIDLDGEGGSDVLAGGLDSFLFGGSGSDALIGHSGGFSYGQSGSDCIFGGTTKDSLMGGTGNDLLCAANSSNSVTRMDGGEDPDGKDVDGRCGTASKIIDIENHNACSSCATCALIIGL